MENGLTLILIQSEDGRGSLAADRRAAVAFRRQRSAPVTPVHRRRHHVRR